MQATTIPAGLAAALAALLILILSGCGGSGGGPPSGGARRPQLPPATDTTAPTLLSTRPQSDAQGVPTNTALLLTFSEAMDAPSTQGALGVTRPDAESAPLPVAGSVSWSDDACALQFNPDGSWLPETVYTVTLAAAASDRAGNPLGIEVAFSFTTGLLTDLVAPRVTFVRPLPGAAGQALNLPVVLGFSEAMDAASVAAAFAFTHEEATVPGSGAWSNAGQVLTFTPSESLLPDTAYMVNVAVGATDLAGNRLATPFTAGFSTGTSEGSTTVVRDGITGTDRDGDGVPDEYTLDLNQLSAAELQDVLDDADFEGTLILTSDPPVQFEVPLFINRDGIQIYVLPSGVVTLDGQDEIDTIVHVGGNGVVVDGLNVTGGLRDLITQSVDEQGNTIPIEGLVLRNLLVKGSLTDDCIQLTACTDCLVEQVVVYNCFSHGISSTGSAGVTIRNATIGCTDEPDCIYGAYSNTGFMHFFKTDGITVSDVEIFRSVRRPGGPGGGFAVKVEQNFGHVLLERLAVHDNFPPVPPEGLDDGGPGDGVLGVVRHQTAWPDGSVTLRDSIFSGNGAPALYFSNEPDVAASLLVEGLTSTGNAGLVQTDRATGCEIRNSTIAESGVTVTAPCTDGGNNTFSP